MSRSRNASKLVDPAEWSGINMRRCSIGARVLYVDLLNLMQMSGSPGILDLSPKVNLEGYPLRLTFEVIHPDAARDLAKHLGFSQQEVTGWLVELVAHGIMELASEWEIRCPKVVRDEEIRQKRANGGVLGGNPTLLKATKSDTEPQDGYEADSSKVNHEGYPLRLSSKVNLPKDTKEPLSLLPSPPAPPLVPPLPPPSYSPLLSPPIIPPRPPQPTTLIPQKEKFQKEKVFELQASDFGVSVPDTTGSTMGIKPAYSQDFEDVWQLYGRKGSKKLSYPIWKKLSEAQRLAATEHIPKYTKSNDKQFLKDFERYLKAELWESDVVNATDPKRRQKPTPQYSRQTLIDNYELVSKLR